MRSINLYKNNPVYQHITNHGLQLRESVIINHPALTLYVNKKSYYLNFNDGIISYWLEQSKGTLQQITMLLNVDNINKIIEGNI